MFMIQLLNGEIFVRLCVWMKNPYVKKAEATRMNVQSGIPVLGSYPSSAILALIPEGQVPLVDRGKQCLASELK